MTNLISIRSIIARRLKMAETDASISHFFGSLHTPLDRESILKQLFEIGQLQILVAYPSFSLEALLHLLDQLIPANDFYKEMGGVVGYHKKIQSLLKKEEEVSSSVLYHAPAFIDISKMDVSTKEAIAWGIDALPEIAEIYPLGGAADRLHLVDACTGAELPAAKLQFAGISLLERLISDVQAREYLYYQIYGKQIVTPIAIMTSMEKENHFHVENMLKAKQWFGRTRESFRIFTQPLVPVVNEQGDWLFSDALKPILKPGGHGAIWKLAHDQGVFSWFETQGRKKALIRQINNPIAGLDYGLLAFIGIGWRKKGKFGFASCPRLLCSAEGVNVLIEKQKKLVLTNIEYCDFAKFGIEDRPLVEGEPYSRFSSNTNLLFADLESVKQAVEKNPFPGLLLNLKKGSFLNGKGEKEEVVLGRLESTMQNLADVFVEEKKDSLVTQDTFITYNQRHKTISTTKKAYVEGGSYQETPESCFYDFLYAARELLESHCGFQLPKRRTLAEYLAQGPEFAFLYHPSIGPLYSLIQQKLQRGILGLGSELWLEASQVWITDLALQGSLRVIADQIMGNIGEEGQLQYSNHVGRCILKNVHVVNRGVDWDNSRPFWKGDFVRFEGLEILLKGSSEFVAEDVTFTGSHRFVVEDGISMYVTEVNGQWVVRESCLERNDLTRSNM